MSFPEHAHDLNTNQTSFTAGFIWGSWDCPVLLFHHGNRGFISEVSCCITVSAAHPLPIRPLAHSLLSPHLRSDPLSLEPARHPARKTSHLSRFLPQIIQRWDLCATHTHTDTHRDIRTGTITNHREYRHTFGAIVKHKNTHALAAIYLIWLFWHLFYALGLFCGSSFILFHILSSSWASLSHRMTAHRLKSEGDVWVYTSLLQYV